jgi:hypothetical protein
MEEIRSIASAGIRSQKLRLLRRANAISGAPFRIGTNQFPKPPTIVGITIKKIMINACAVTTTLNSWWLPKKKVLPGLDSSRRIRTLRSVPTTPERAPNKKYREPISL